MNSAAEPVIIKTNKVGLRGNYYGMNKKLVCIRCPEARFIDPKKEICYKTGGLFCRKLKAVVGKYDACRLKRAKARGKGGVTTKKR